MEQLHLAELFDTETLQRLQDSFSAAAGLSAELFDENGVVLTEHNVNCEFCTKYTRGSEEGKQRCRSCGKQALEAAMQDGKPKLHICHAGLTNFAAPIMLNGQFLGCFLGGRVLTGPLQEEKVLAYAKELGIPPEEYAEAAGRIPVFPKEKVEGVAQYLYEMGDILSHMAYKQHMILQASSELEQEAHMKSDFLANMSHEIRTPMNAVIGMAAMALREELPPVARGYIKQIIASGNTLLTIINDILDFSKLESGKMNINMAEYKMFSVVKDVASVIMERIGDKKLEFVVDVAPDIPKQLMGDSIRISQIIMNLANNAVKFTKEGCVYLSVNYEKRTEREILLKVSVRDTGIGIKEEDIGKLFQSFQQLDSKRKRNVEGTGLGLAISRQLVTLMNGKIGLTSEYGKGSCFSFEIPQIVLDDTPSVLVEDARKTAKAAGVLCSSAYLLKSMEKMLKALHVECVPVQSPEDLDALGEEAEFFFIERDCYSLQVQKYLKGHPKMTGVVLIGFKEAIDIRLENVVAVRKPLYILKLAKILAHEDLYADEDDSEKEEFEFIAPEAEVLIVDDNTVNLTVAEGLIAPLQMKVDKAISGKQALEMIEDKHYDLILMDHMMPELDGIETTRIIRRFHEDYDTVPIIALTANVMEEMRAMFLVEGMNDFIAKPIESKVIVAKLKQWIPAKKQKKVVGGEKHEEQQKVSMQIDIPELDTCHALQMLGSETLYVQILEDYAKMIPKKAQLIEQHKKEEDWKAYTIETHALKSSSKQVGAMELSELAAQMEAAGNRNDIGFILAHHEELMEKYLALEPVLAKYIEVPKEEEGPKTDCPPETVMAYLDNMQEAVDNLDMDDMDRVMGQLGQIALGDIEAQYLKGMKEAAEELDVETCEKLIKEWKQQISV